MKGDYFMKRMVDNKKLREIETSGGTQWYSHKLTKSGGKYIEFVLPFEKNLFEIARTPLYKNVFGVVLEIFGPSIGDIDVKSTFPNLRFNSSQIQCFTAKSNGSIATTEINITDYIEDIVTKYQVI